MTVIAHLVGGPHCGKVLAVPDEQIDIRFAVVSPVSVASGLVPEVPFTRTMIYVRSYLPRIEWERAYDYLFAGGAY